MTSVRESIEAAASKLLSSETKLADACEVTQNAIWQAKREEGSPSAVGAAMSGAVIIAQLIGHDRAQAGDLVVRSRSPVFALCRALLAAGANPNSKLECFRGSVLALTVKTIGIGAKLTVKENNWVGPKVVLYEPLSRDRVGRHVRQNDDPAPSPLADDSLAEGMAARRKTQAGKSGRC
jgi:hypothetical protein